jgi:hypothetical protein
MAMASCPHSGPHARGPLVHDCLERSTAATAYLPCSPVSSESRRNSGGSFVLWQGAPCRGRLRAGVIHFLVEGDHGRRRGRQSDEDRLRPEPWRSRGGTGGRGARSPMPGSAGTHGRLEMPAWMSSRSTRRSDRPRTTGGPTWRRSPTSPPRPWSPRRCRLLESGGRPIRRPRPSPSWETPRTTRRGSHPLPDRTLPPQPQPQPRPQPQTWWNVAPPRLTRGQASHRLLLHPSPVPTDGRPCPSPAARASVALPWPPSSSPCSAVSCSSPTASARPRVSTPDARIPPRPRLRCLRRQPPRLPTRCGRRTRCRAALRTPASLPRRPAPPLLQRGRHRPALPHRATRSCLC